MKPAKQLFISVIVLSVIFITSCGYVSEPDQSNNNAGEHNKLIQGEVMEEEDLDIDGHHYEWIRYCLEDGGIRIIGLRTKEDVLVVPSVFLDYSVIRIGGTNSETMGEPYIWNIDEEQQLKKIIISEGIKEILDRGMTQVGADEIVLPESLEIAGEQSFMKSRISKVEVKGHETELRYAAFKTSQLKKITFPEDFRGTIETGCFSDSLMEKFQCPSNIEELDFFFDCKNLKEIAFSENHSKVLIPEYGFSGCSSLKKLTFPASVRTVRIMPSLYADDTKGEGVPVLIFEGKDTVLRCVDRDEKKISGYIPAGKIVAPKGSKAIQTAKKSKKIASFTPLGKERIRQGEFIYENPGFYKQKELVSLVPMEYEEKS